MLMWTPVVLAASDNPFESERMRSEPAPAAGEFHRCEMMLEHFLVETELIDRWERSEGGSDANLYEKLREWLEEGRVKLDCTGWVAGLTGKEMLLEQIIEPIYPTSYYPGGKGAWPFPASFETYNCGYDFRPQMLLGKAGWSANWDFGWSRMISPGTVHHVIADATRHPDDVFLPVFRRLEGNALRSLRGDHSDPFAATGSTKDTKSVPSPILHPANHLDLLSRLDGEDGAEDGYSRLVFASSRLGEKVEVPTPDKPLKIKMRIRRVPHRTVWTWLSSEGVDPLADLAWDESQSWPTELVASLDGWAQIQSTTEISQTEGIVYPTEWMPTAEWEETARWEEQEERGGKKGTATRVRKKVVEPAVGVEMSATPTSFETRNVGAEIEASVEGGLISLVIDNVDQVGKSILHRVKEGDKWVADATMPVFARHAVTTTLPFRPCGWTLIGVNGEYLAGGVPDTENRLLYFVKLE